MFSRNASALLRSCVIAPHSCIGPQAYSAGHYPGAVSGTELRGARFAVPRRKYHRSNRWRRTSRAVPSTTRPSPAKRRKGAANGGWVKFRKQPPQERSAASGLKESSAFRRPVRVFHDLDRSPKLLRRILLQTALNMFSLMLYDLLLSRMEIFDCREASLAVSIPSSSPVCSERGPWHHKMRSGETFPAA